MALSKRDYIIPSALLNKTFMVHANDADFMADQVAYLSMQGFYRSVEINPITDKSKRAAICKCMGSSGNKLDRLTVWCSYYLRSHKLHLCALDEPMRLEAVEAVKKLCAEAKETGATAIGFTCGADVGILQRSECYRSLINSVSEIADYAAKQQLNLYLKPSDNTKERKILSLSSDVKELLDLVCKSHHNVYLCFDTSHVALNHEELNSTLDLFGNQICNLHLSNAVLDYYNPQYGSIHTEPGEPGFLTSKRAQLLLEHAYSSGIGTEQGLTVAFDCTQELKPGHNDKRCFELSTDFLKQVFLEFILNS
ncbi:MAG: sugar phosphate isomerase/epimerase [Succinivibrio sp.]|nr:sugar phosphate isomerase/epimerase [Succinivibrio sp.]